MVTDGLGGPSSGSEPILRYSQSVGQTAAVFGLRCVLQNERAACSTRSESDLANKQGAAILSEGK